MDRIYNKVVLVLHSDSKLPFVQHVKNRIWVGQIVLLIFGFLKILYILLKCFHIYSHFTFWQPSKSPPLPSNANNNSYDNNRLKNKYQGCSVFCSKSHLGSSLVLVSPVMSDSLRPHEPTRLLCPWDFPDKNAGVGCHFLLWAVVGEKSWKRDHCALFL